jgi:hypothetical protein
VNLVLVESDQATQSLGGQLLEQDRVGRLVAGKDLALDERFVLGLFRSELFDDLFFGLSESESPDEEMGLNESTSIV